MTGRSESAHAKSAQMDERGMSIAEIVSLSRELESEGADIIHLEQGEPDFRTPAHIVAAASEALDAGYTHYVSAAGLPELREAVSEQLKSDYSILTDRSEITITNGGTLGLYLALHATVGRGGEVLMANPSFGQFRLIAEQLGARPIYVDVDDKEGRFLFDPKRLERAITSKTKAVIINSPDNPTGTVYRDNELRAVAEVALKHNLHVISDEIYHKLTFDDLPHRSIVSACPDVKERTIIVNSFSKTYSMTGWRLGYNVATRNLTSKMVKLYHSSARCAAAFVQRAGLAALEGSEEWVAETRRTYARRREVMAEELEGVPHVKFGKPEGAFYFFVNISDTGMDSAALVLNLVKEAGVAVAPGPYFGPAGKSYIRLSFACSESHIREGIGRIRRYLKPG